VLLDVGVAADEFLSIVRRAPEIFDVRLALETLNPPAEDDYRPFSRRYGEAPQTFGTRRQVESSYHPEIVMSPRLANSVPWPVYDEVRAEEYARELVHRAERRKVLRAKWDGGKKPQPGGVGIGRR
jgi:hypothetical protein